MSVNWEDPLEDNRNRAFIVAGGATDAWIRGARAAIEAGIAAEMTLREFRDHFDKAVAARTAPSAERENRS